ncbi:MAG: hypothetical protein J6C93_07715 [Clostridia bacterium]|nr:hypothetical protein [Clostridia bacterium]
MAKDKRKFGWALTKWFPHKRHPAHYRKKGKKSDDVEYVTFTHSEEVILPNGSKVYTIPMNDNVSKKEREENKRKGLKKGENRSYAYPKVFEGKRSALGKESDEFDPVSEDVKRIAMMYELLPRENVPETGGKTKHRQRKKKKPRKDPEQ